MRDWLVWKSQIVFQYRVEGQHYSLAPEFLLNWSVLSKYLAVSFKDTKWVYCLEGQNNFISIFKCLGKIPNRRTNWTRKKVEIESNRGKNFLQQVVTSFRRRQTAPKCLELHINSRIFITPEKRITIIYSATIMCQAWVIALKTTIIWQEKIFYAYFIVVETKVLPTKFLPKLTFFLILREGKEHISLNTLWLNRPNRKPTCSYL